MAFIKSFAAKEIFEITGLWIYGMLISIVVPAAFGFAAGGFEGGFISEFMSKYIFYYGFVFGGLLLLTALKIREIVVVGDRNPEKAKRATWLSTAIVHDPIQDGFIGNLSAKAMGWARNPIRLFLASVIVFTLFGLFGAVTNTFFASIPQIEFQVTETAQVVFAAEPASFGETIMFIALLSLQFGLAKYFQIRHKIPFWVFWTSALVIFPVLIGFEWMGMHILRYGADETRLLATWIFGAFGALMTLLTGSFIPWLVWHDANNIFAKLSKLIASEERIVIVTVILLVVIVVAWIAMELWIRKLRRRELVERGGKIFVATGS